MHTRQLRVFAPTPHPPARVINEICFFVFETRYSLQSKKGRKIEGSCWLFLVRTTATGFSLLFFACLRKIWGCGISDARRGLATVRARAHTQISERRVPVRTELLYERAPGGERDGGNTWAPQT